MLRIGFFPKFNATDAVLISGTSEDVASLSAQLAPLLTGDQATLVIHELAEVAPNHRLKLFAVLAPPQSQEIGTFFWPCTKHNRKEIKEKLVSLATSVTGHHYFELADIPVTLIISVGEYTDDWWQNHG